MTQQEGALHLSALPTTLSRTKKNMTEMPGLPPALPPNLCRICVGFSFSESLLPAASCGNTEAAATCPADCRATAPCFPSPCEPSLPRNRHAPLRPCPLAPSTPHPSRSALMPPPRAAARGAAAPAATRPAQGAASEAAPLRPSAPQQPLPLHHLGIHHLRLRGQGPIDLLHPRQTLLDRRQHLLLQPRDLLFSIGPINPAAPQRPAGMTPEDAFDRLASGLQQQELILLWPAERRGRCRAWGHGDGCREQASGNASRLTRQPQDHQPWARPPRSSCCAPCWMGPCAARATTTMWTRTGS
jgi:hypothetical protein